jgi:hypothetical protein
MYHGPAALTSLPVTGFALATGHMVVAGATLIFFGLAVLRMIPKRES